MRGASGSRCPAAGGPRAWPGYVRQRALRGLTGSARIYGRAGKCPLKRH
jgi:hypothetical protein